MIDSLSIILCRKSSYNRLCLYRVLKHENEKIRVLEQPCPSKKNIKKLNTNIFMRTLFSLFQISERNRANVKSYKESCQLAFAKRIRHVSKEMAKIMSLKIFWCLKWCIIIVRWKLFLVKNDTNWRKYKVVILYIIIDIKTNQVENLKHYYIILSN